MPVVEESVLRISCDSPACPGNTLDQSDRTGWLFVSSEVYGQAAQSHVYCCAECAGADASRAFVPSEAEPVTEVLAPG